MTKHDSTVLAVVVTDNPKDRMHMLTTVSFALVAVAHEEGVCWLDQSIVHSIAVHCFNAMTLHVS